MKTRIEIIAGCLMMILLHSEVRSQNNSSSSSVSVVNSGSILKSTTDEGLNILTLGIEGNGNRDEQIIVQTDLGTDGFDEYDSEKMFNNNSNVAEIYTVAPTGEKLVIQSVKPISFIKQFNLGVKISKTGSYKLTADLSSFSADEKVTLEDKSLRVIQDLRENPDYQFLSDITNDTSRFVITISLKGTLKVVEPYTVTAIANNTDKETSIYLTSNGISITNCNIGSDIMVFDMLGKCYYQSKASNEMEIIPASFKTGYYIVRISDAGNAKTQKIFIQ